MPPLPVDTIWEQPLFKIVYCCFLYNKIWSHCFARQYIGVLILFPKVRPSSAKNSQLHNPQFPLTFGSQHTQWEPIMDNLTFGDIFKIFPRLPSVKTPEVNRKFIVPSIAYTSLQRHQRRWCTFFKPVYFFPQETQKGLLWVKFMQTKHKCKSCYFCDEITR